MCDKFIPLSVPVIQGNELKYVEDAIKTGWLAEGEYIKKFEDKIKEITGSKFAVALNSGTSGLFLALKVLGIGENDEVIVPTLTFIATINSINYTGADVVFMDCDDYLNIDVLKIAEFCENECDFVDGKLLNKTTRKYIKAIMPVHIFGIPCDIFKLKEIANKYNLKIIEDATESLGSSFEDGVSTGNVGDMGIFSFNGNKITTCGGGGCLITNNEKYAKKVRYLSTQSKDDAVYFLHNEIGYNFRLSNVSSAIGLAQIENLQNIIKIKQKNFEIYKKSGLKFIEPPKSVKSNYWFYSLICDNRDELLNIFAENKIQTRPIWKLNHTQKPFLNCQNYKIEKAKFYYDRILNLPCSVDLTEDAILRICNIIKNRGENA